MTEALQQLSQYNFLSMLILIFLLMSAIVTAVMLIGKFSEIIKRPVSWVRKKNEDHELLIKTAKSLNELRVKQEEDTEQSIRHDKMIKEDLEKLTLIIQDKNINDWRYEILDMASAISSGRKYSKEQYDHVIDIHGRYEDLLKSLGRTNGQVNVSMEVIMESYKEKLKNGF